MGTRYAADFDEAGSGRQGTPGRPKEAGIGFSEPRVARFIARD